MPPRDRDADHPDATLLFRRGDGDGALEVYEQPPLRWLQYGSGTIQSLIDLDRPRSLVLPYTQALMGCLLFQSPASALMLGLGGGSCARFLLYHLPRMRLEAVDSDPHAAAIAARYFGLRPEPRLALLTEDARTAVARPDPAVGLIVIDLFEAGGLPRWACEPPLYASCRRRLARPGVLAANLWVDDDDEFLTVIGGIREVFAGRCLVLPVTGYRNLTVFAFNPPEPELRLPALYRRAQELRARTGVDFPAQIDRLRECNLVDEGRLVL